MKKILFVALVAICSASCSNTGSSTTDDSNSPTSSDSLGAGNSGSANMQGTGSGGSGNSSMQGTGTDTGYHGAAMDSSRMGGSDTSGNKNK